MKKFVMASLVGATMMTLSAPVVSAEVATSEKHAKTVVEFRQALLQLVRSNVGVLGAMAKGKVEYDTEVMLTNGERLEQLSLMMDDYFATDTRNFDVETAALDKIWTQQEDFDSKVDAMTEAARTLQAAAKSGDKGQYKAAIGGIFKTCKGCHDSYKAD